MHPLLLFLIFQAVSCFGHSEVADSELPTQLIRSQQNEFTDYDLCARALLEVRPNPNFHKDYSNGKNFRSSNMNAYENGCTLFVTQAALKDSSLISLCSSEAKQLILPPYSLFTKGTESGTPVFEYRFRLDNPASDERLTFGYIVYDITKRLADHPALIRKGIYSPGRKDDAALKPLSQKENSISFIRTEISRELASEVSSIPSALNDWKAKGLMGGDTFKRSVEAVICACQETSATKVSSAVLNLIQHPLLKPLNLKPPCSLNFPRS